MARSSSTRPSGLCRYLCAITRSLAARTRTTASCGNSAPAIVRPAGTLTTAMGILRSASDTVVDATWIQMTIAAARQAIFKPMRFMAGYSPGKRSL